MITVILVSTTLGTERIGERASRIGCVPQLTAAAAAQAGTSTYAEYAFGAGTRRPSALSPSR